MCFGQRLAGPGLHRVRSSHPRSSSTGENGQHRLQWHQNVTGVCAVTRERFLYILDKPAGLERKMMGVAGRELTTTLPPLFFTKTRSFHSKVMKHHGRLIPSPRWALCQRPESLQVTRHRPPLSSVEALALIRAEFFVAFQRIRPGTHRTNSNLMNRLNLGAPLYHIVSTPCPLPQQSPHCRPGRTRFKK